MVWKEHPEMSDREGLHNLQSMGSNVYEEQFELHIIDPYFGKEYTIREMNFFFFLT